MCSMHVHLHLISISIPSFPWQPVSHKVSCHNMKLLYYTKAELGLTSNPQTPLCNFQTLQRFKSHVHKCHTMNTTVIQSFLVRLQNWPYKYLQCFYLTSVTADNLQNYKGQSCLPYGSPKNRTNCYIFLISVIFSTKHLESSSLTKKLLLAQTIFIN